MKLRDYFKQAIESGDWNKVCKVYKQVVGEEISPPRVVSIANMEMQDDETATSPADEEMDDEDEDEDDTSLPVEQVEDQQVANANSTRNSTVDEFRVTRKQKDDNGEGKLARREPIRKFNNKFCDNHTIAMKDSVKNKPHLGVQNPCPRGNRDLIEGAIDTSKRVDVVCSLCGRKENVSEQLAVGWYKDKPNTKEEDRQNTYKCNKCQTPAGRTELLRKKRNK